MKFIISSISMSMFTDKSFDLRTHELTEEEFQVLSYDAYSCVGHEDIANVLNVAYNREPVKARVGDTLLLAQMYGGTLHFYCIQVADSSVPLIRTEELEYIDEEMI